MRCHARQNGHSGQPDKAAKEHHHHPRHSVRYTPTLLDFLALRTHINCHFCRYTFTVRGLMGVSRSIMDRSQQATYSRGGASMLRVQTRSILQNIHNHS